MRYDQFVVRDRYPHAEIREWAEEYEDYTWGQMLGQLLEEVRELGGDDGS